MNKTTKAIFLTGGIIVAIMMAKAVYTYTTIRQKFSDALKIKFEKFKISGYEHPKLATEVKIYIDNRTEWQFNITDIKLNIIQSGKQLATVNQKYPDELLVPANGSISVSFNPEFLLNEIYAQGPAVINEPLKVTGHIGIRKGRLGYFNIPINYSLPSVAQLGTQFLNNIKI